NLDTKQRSIWILVRSSGRASSQFRILPNETRPRHIDVDIVLIIRINDEGMRVRTSASLHCRDLLRILDVADVEDSHSAETIFVRGRKIRPGRTWRARRIGRKSLSTAIKPAVRRR